METFSREQLADWLISRQGLYDDLKSTGRTIGQAWDWAVEELAEKILTESSENIINPKSPLTGEPFIRKEVSSK